VGRVVAPGADDETLLLALGVAAHAAVSLGWGMVLAALLPRRHPVAAGAAAGLAIAALDLGVIGRRLGPIRHLALGPEVLAHLAYGVVAGAVLTRRRAAGRAGARDGAGSRCGRCPSSWP